MNETRTSLTSHLTTRIAVLIAGVVLALVVGAPWLLLDAPPSPEAVFAARLCCVKAPPVLAPGVAPRIAPSK
jgi:hypothetical protein